MISKDTEFIPILFEINVVIGSVIILIVGRISHEKRDVDIAKLYYFKMINNSVRKEIHEKFT